MPPKSTNPKAAHGAAKPSLSVVPTTALYLVAAAMVDGAYKYGAHNWRSSSVDAHTYYDAALRHITSWWEGEDVAPDSGIPHLAHAMACLVILLDAEACGRLIDDRPIPPPADWMEEMRKLHAFVTAGREPAARFTKEDL